MFSNPSQATAYNYTKQVTYKYKNKVILVCGREGIGKTTVYLKYILPNWGISSIYIDLKTQDLSTLQLNKKVIFIDNLSSTKNYETLMKTLISIVNKGIWLILTTNDFFEGVSILNDISLPPNSYPIVHLTPVPFKAYLSEVVFHKPLTIDFFVLSSHNHLTNYLHWLNDKLQIYFPYHELVGLHLGVLYDRVDDISPGVFDVYNNAGEVERITLTTWNIPPLINKVLHQPDSYVGIPVNNAAMFLDNIYINDKLLLALECEEYVKINNEIKRRGVLLPRKIYKDWITNHSTKWC